MSNQSKLGLINPISPTSPVMDWVTITFLTMDWNCNGYIFSSKPIHQYIFVIFLLQIAIFLQFYLEIQISRSAWKMKVLKNSLWLNSIKASFLWSNKEQTFWKFLHFISLKFRIKLDFGLVDWWTDQYKKIFKMDWCIGNQYIFRAGLGTGIGSI